jgi:uncharacterized protein YegP (UPF0339 family)
LAWQTDEENRATEREQPTMYFEILAAAGGGWFARIKGGNNEIMFSSQVYTTKQSAIHACEVVKANAATAKIYA